jgi:hypothetical protein
VIAMLLLIAAIAVLYLNRHLLIEHRTSASQWHGAVASEAAEAGLDWVQDRLNHPGWLDAQCQPATLATGGTDFRASHLPTGALPAPGAGCRLPGGPLDCACPAGQSAGAGAGAGDTVARFSVRLVPETGSDAIRAQALGCAADQAPCDLATPDPADADARTLLSVALRPVPLLPSLPTAALTCAGDCRLLEQASLSNQQASGQGLAAHSAGALSRGVGTQLRGLPGTPLADATVENDLALASAAGTPCNAEALFEHLFQQGLAGYARSPLTRHLSCPADADCGPTIRAAHALGWRAFYLPAGARLGGGEPIGSPEAPVALVTPGALSIENAPSIHGLLFSNDTRVNTGDGGAAHIVGASVGCASHHQGGQSEVSRDADTLARLREVTRAYQRVPGSWRDAP